MLSRSELEHQSLFIYLKEAVLAREFSQEIQNEPLINEFREFNGIVPSGYLIVDPNNSKFGKKSSSEGRGWLSFDTTNYNTSYVYNETISGYVPTYNTPFFNNSFSIPTKREYNYIKVRDQYGDLMDRSWYQLDYNNCRVRYPCPTTPSGVVISGLKPTSIDYRFHSVSIVDGYPSNETIPELPIISIYPVTELINGIQIGPGVEFKRSYRIDIFATDNANKRQLVDIIKQALFNKHVPVIDFNRSGYPLKNHGVINNNFIQTLEYNGENYNTYLTLNSGNGQLLYFFNVEGYYDNSPRDVMSNSTRHMAKITFTTSSYSDRDPDLVGKFSGVREPLGGFDSLVRKAYTA